MASPSPDHVTASPSIELKIHSQLPIPDHLITFADLSVATTVAQLKLQIRDRVPSKPDVQHQRLIYRGRVLQREADTLEHVIGASAAQNGSSHHFHLVIREANPGPIYASRLTTSSETPDAAAAPRAPRPIPPQPYGRDTQGFPPPAGMPAPGNPNGVPDFMRHPVMPGQAPRPSTAPPNHLPVIPQMIQQERQGMVLPPHLAQRMAQHAAALAHNAQQHRNHASLHFPDNTSNNSGSGVNQSDGTHSAEDHISHHSTAPQGVHTRHEHILGPNGESISMVVNTYSNRNDSGHHPPLSAHHGPFHPPQIPVPFGIQPPPMFAAPPGVAFGHFHHPSLPNSESPQNAGRGSLTMQQVIASPVNSMHQLEREIHSSVERLRIAVTNPSNSAGLSMMHQRFTSLIRVFNSYQTYINATIPNNSSNATPSLPGGQQQMILSEADVQRLTTINRSAHAVVEEARGLFNRALRARQTSSQRNGQQGPIGSQANTTAYLLNSPNGLHAIIHGPMGNYSGHTGGHINGSGNIAVHGNGNAGPTDNETFMLMNRHVANASHAVAMMNREIAQANSTVALANSTISDMNRQLAAAGSQEGVSGRHADSGIEHPLRDAHHDGQEQRQQSLARLAEARRRLEQHQQHLRQQQQQLQPPQQPPQQQQERDEFADAFRMIGPIFSHLWLLARVFGFIWFFTGGFGMRRAILLGVAACIYIAVQAGVFADQFNHLYRHFDDLLRAPVEPAPAPPNAQAAARQDGDAAQAEGAGRRQGRAAEPDPRETAERLLRERREADRGWLQDRIRTIERAVALFIASLYPGVGERHVAAHERQRREADAQEAQRRAEAEAEAAASAAATETTENGEQGQTQVEDAESRKTDAAAPRDGADGGEGSSTSVQLNEHQAQHRPTAGASDAT